MELELPPKDITNKYCTCTCYKIQIHVTQIKTNEYNTNIKNLFYYITKNEIDKLVRFIKIKYSCNGNINDNVVTFTGDKCIQVMECLKKRYNILDYYIYYK
jgi:translation initiation factor 1 (eIF-1/SUI1)